MFTCSRLACTSLVTVLTNALTKFARNEVRLESARLREIHDNCRGQEAEEQNWRVYVGGMLSEEEDKFVDCVRGSDTSCREKKAGRWTEAKLLYFIICANSFCSLQDSYQSYTERFLFK